MKSKKIKYLLIVFVILIWSTIIYKVYTSVYESDDAVHFSKKNKTEKILKNKLDSFNISVNYPDPFLKGMNTEAVKKRLDSGYNKSTRHNPVPVKVVSKWPEIRYNGLVSGKAGVKLSILLSINGKSFILKKGEIVDGIEILVINKDSIKMKYENMVKYLRRYESK